LAPAKICAWRPVALMEIRDNDLYKEAGYTSWQKYLTDNEAKFGIGSERQANRYIAAARVMPALPQTRTAASGSGWAEATVTQTD